MRMPIAESDISSKAIALAQERLRRVVVRTPLLRFETGHHAIWLKPEMLQPYGSFKIRCSANALATLPSSTREIYTASSGNFAQGLTVMASNRGIAVRAYVPSNADPTKLQYLRRLGATVVSCDAEQWWAIVNGDRPVAERGVYISPCDNPAVIAGDATIGCEIVDDLPSVDTILVPFGGGGLVAGIAIAAKQRNPHIRIVACEAEGSTPLRDALAAGRPVRIPSASTFVTGIGGLSVLDSMWPLLRVFVTEACVIPTSDIAAAIRLLARQNSLIAEGAGAIALAAALKRKPSENVVAVLSGGNIDPAVFARILSGGDD